MNAPPPERVATRGEAFGKAAVGVGCSAAACALACAQKSFFSQGRDRVSAAVVFGVLTALFLGALVASRRLKGREGAVASLATLGWLPMIFLGLGVSGEAVVAPEGHLQCGTWMAGAILVGPFVLLPMVVVSSLLATRARFPTADRTIRAGAYTSLVLVGLAAAFGLAHIDRPDPDTYFTSLPVVGDIHANETLALGDGTRVTYRHRDPNAPESSNQSLGSCVLEGVGTGWLPAMRAESCPSLDVKHDAKSGLWILETAGSVSFAFLEPEKKSRDIWPRDVGASIAPPIGWTVGGVVGLILGAVLVGLAHQTRRRGDTLGGIEGTAQGDGWVAIHGRAPIHLPETSGVAPGPVLVFLRGGPDATYREMASVVVESWQPVTLQEAKDALASRATTLYALAMTSALLPAAPLLLSGLGGSR